MKKINTHSFMVNGKYRTKALFREFSYEEDVLENDHCVYTIAREDNPPYHSLYSLYMKEGDPTEASFVEKYMFNLRHWETLCDTVWFKPHIIEWRKELNLKIHSKLVSYLIEDAASEVSKTSTTSAKYLLDNYFREKKTTTTTNEDKKANTARERGVIDLTKEDAERIGILRKVN